MMPKDKIIIIILIVLIATNSQASTGIDSVGYLWLSGLVLLGLLWLALWLLRFLRRIRSDSKKYDQSKD